MGKQRCIWDCVWRAATSIRPRSWRAGSARSVKPSGWFPILWLVRIGVLGGTFDPPHMAHLHMGEVAYRQLGLHRVIFMPAGSPWQKAGRDVSSPDHRWEMSRLAVTGVEYFEADDREVHRNGWTYTADTLASFGDEADITLILGADTAGNLRTWHRADEVLERVNLAVAPRSGTAIDVESLLPPFPGTLTWLDMAPMEVSGTLIRQRLASGRPVRFLVRDSVWRYFTERALYGVEVEPPVG